MGDDAYSLLNAFEMLWAPGSKPLHLAPFMEIPQQSDEPASAATTVIEDKDLDPDQPINEMDLVEIRSHPVEDCSVKSAAPDTTK